MAANTSHWFFAALDNLDNCSNYNESWLWLASMQPAYLWLVTFVGLLGNGLVLGVFFLQSRPCSVADVYLGNMAAADFVMMCCLPFWAVTIARGYQWAFGQLLCKLVNMAISMNYICSILFLMLVSIDRYLALVKPMNPSRLRRVSWARRLCLVIWIIGFLFTFPVLLFRGVSYLEDPGVDACILEYPQPGWRLYNNVSNFWLGYLIPMIVISYCTHYIIKALNLHEFRHLSGLRTERKATHLVLAVLMVFFFCWTPHQLMRILDTLDYFKLTPGCLWGHILDIGIQLSTYLAYSNSAVNPFLFAIVGTHFQKRVKDIFRKTLNSWSRDKLYMSVSFTSTKEVKETQHVITNNVEIFSTERRKDSDSIK